MRFHALILALFLGTMLNPGEVHAQSWLPVILDNDGDTVRYSYPPPDSSFVANEVVIIFQREGIRSDYLCYSFEDPVTRKPDGESTQGLTTAQRQTLFNEKIPVDSLVVDPGLRSLFHSFGLDTLMRLSDVNPCVDTISVSRSGDTIPSHHYLYMKGLLDNDTSVIALSGLATVLHLASVQLVEPNYIGFLHRNPNDPHY